MTAILLVVIIAAEHCVPTVPRVGGGPARGSQGHAGPVVGPVARAGGMGQWHGPVAAAQAP